MSGILLSFSLPEMLPELLYGVCLAGGLDGSAADADMWCLEKTGRSALDVESVKRQTIRAFDPAASSPRSPYRRVVAGDRAHIWWKSRTPSRRKLGAVTITAVEPVEMRWVSGGFSVWTGAHCKDLIGIVLADGSQLGDLRGEFDAVTAFARADGFDSAAAMIAYFEAHAVGDVFRGLRIAW